MPEIEVSIELYCGGCGGGICHNANVSSKHSNRPAFTVDPCEKCMERSDQEGYDRGFKEGRESNG